MVELPSAEHVALAAVSVLAAIVAWDAYWLTKQRRDVPELGSLKGGGFAWASEGVHEMVRQWGNLGSMAAMMVLPWALLEASNTPMIYAILWDVFLGLHLISLLVPKRYAITSTHLFADGQRYPWERLRLAKRQPKRRIMLLETDGAVRPAPLGGDQHRSARHGNTSTPWNKHGEEPLLRTKQNERHPHGPSSSAGSMEWTQSGDDVFVRLDPGEEIHAALQSLADSMGFDAAAITSGIGRARDSTYGYMDDDHVYHRVTLDGGTELVTLQGNLARRENGDAFTHLHATFSDDDLKPHAGHMFSATVHVVAEIHLRILSQAVMTRCPLENSEFVALSFK